MDTPLVRPYPENPPRGFVDHVYRHEWTIEHPRSSVWAWLCDPKTFTDGQIPPFRVEFVDKPDGEGGFTEGVYNAHVGPFMSFSGILGEIRPPEYRDLHYFYGSYALSHALFRPTRLQFWLEELGPDRTRLKLRVDAHVRRRATKLWVAGMKAFWPRFGTWANRQASGAATALRH